MAAATATAPAPGEMEKGMFEELLLVCQYVGTKRGAAEDESEAAGSDGVGPICGVPGCKE